MSIKYSNVNYLIFKLASKASMETVLTQNTFVVVYPNGLEYDYGCKQFYPNPWIYKNNDNKTNLYLKKHNNKKYGPRSRVFNITEATKFTNYNVALTEAKNSSGIVMELITEYKIKER